jgi:Cu/Ag efflux pump CusA
MAAGHDAFSAIVESAVRRFRPITLTAAAAVLALIPLAAEVFWAPMALAMMGGLIAATVLTLTFLPALYALAFRVTIPGRSGAGTSNPANVTGVPPNVQGALQIAAE